MRLAARDVRADLEDPGADLGHRTDQAIELRPLGDATRDRRIVRRHVRRRARAGEAHRARAHRLLHGGGHAGEISVGGRLMESAFAHHVHAQRGVAEIRAVVDRLGQAVDGREIFREALPRPVDAGQHRRGRDVLDRGQAPRVPLALLRPTRGEGESTVAHDHRRDAMPAGAAAEPVPRHLRVHVRVSVDESRRDDQALGVDGVLGRAPDASQLDDAAVRDADVAAITRRARAVDDRPVANQEIETHGHLPGALAFTLERRQWRR